MIYDDILELFKVKNEYPNIVGTSKTKPLLWGDIDLNLYDIEDLTIIPNEYFKKNIDKSFNIVKSRILNNKGDYKRYKRKIPKINKNIIEIKIDIVYLKLYFPVEVSCVYRSIDYDIQDLTPSKMLKKYKEDNNLFKYIKYGYSNDLLKGIKFKNVVKNIPLRILNVLHQRLQAIEATKKPKQYKDLKDMITYEINKINQTRGEITSDKILKIMNSKTNEILKDKNALDYVGLGNVNPYIQIPISI